MNTGGAGKDPVEQRLVCMGKRFKPDENNEDTAITIDNLHAIFESCGRSVASVVAGGAHDKGRLIAALDALEQAKNIAIQAIHLAQ